MMCPEISQITHKADQNCADLQPWKDYYKRRGLEMSVFLALEGKRSYGNVLEIGCGNGFTASILSRVSADVVATDIPGESRDTHSVGIRRAGQLLSALGTRNVGIVSSVSEELPFDSGSFDTVFSLYVMEHVSNKRQSLKEMHRVLKDGGMCIAIVPNWPERIWACLYQYRYFLIRAWYYAAGKKIGAQKDRNNREDRGRGQGVNNRETDIHPEMSMKRFRQFYPHFPLPEPHGNYDNVWREFIAHFPNVWTRHFRDAGFSVETVFPTIMMPWDLIGLLGGDVPLALYGKTPMWVHKLGALFPFKYLGNNLCIIARKGSA